MSDERWNQIDKLLQSALDRPAAERDVFLQRACSGDKQLEHEVRSLLAAHEATTAYSPLRRSMWPRASSLESAVAMTSKVAAIR